MSANVNYGKSFEKEEEQDKGRNNNYRKPEDAAALITLMVGLIVYGDEDTLLPKHPGYRSLYERLNTFKQWPISIHQKPQDLAEAGYFYLQRGDEVRCYHCGRLFKNWVESDDPWEKHGASECVYMKLRQALQF